MKSLDIIIIAGGRGERLMPLTQYIPKSLITITKDGKTILDKQIEAIRKNPEISDIFLITGYRAKDIEEKVKGYDDGRIKTLFDPYRISNLLGLWCAMPCMDKNVIITNGDNILSPNALKKLIYADEGIHLLVSKKENYDMGDMKVSLKNGKIFRVSKEIHPNKIYAESVSTVKVEGEMYRKLWKDSLNELIREIGGEEDRGKREDMYKKTFWTETFNKVIAKKGSVDYIEIPDKEWKEFDFHPDAEKLKKMILDNSLVTGDLDW